ncbi:MAG: SagB/ThcOx family dehydrogenase [Chloroflexota bacterium]
MAGSDSPGIGDTFQRETRYLRGQGFGEPLDWAAQPEPYKEYADAPIVALEWSACEGGMSLWEALARRRSVRAYGGEPVTLGELAGLLWAGQGITHREGDYALRAAPSAGALYPIETYVVAHRVDGLTAGLYHYRVRGHALESLRAADLRDPIARAALNQRIAHDADLVLAWTAVFGRSKWKYGQRAYRYIYLDAGHIAENVALAAVALGLVSCHIAALYDLEANALLGVDGEGESVIYMTAVGREE